MKFEKSKLTLLITIYKFDNSSKLEYWIKQYSVWKNKIKIVFLFDGVYPNESFKNIVKNEDYFISKENVGRLNLVIDFIKNSNVKTEYFKTIDPDDFISIKNILKTNLPTGFSIINFSYTPFNKNPLFKNDFFVTLKLNLKKPRPSNSFGTSFTIISTESIYNETSFNFENIRINDDQTLGILAWWQNQKVTSIESKFYYYVLNIGQLQDGKTFENNIETTLRFVTSKLDERKEGNLVTMPNINWPRTIISKIERMDDKKLNSKLLDLVEKIEKEKKND